MEDLKKWYRAGLATRIEALKAARRELDGSPGPIESVRRIAHTLRGSGTTYGFPEITETAAALEDSSPEAFPAALETLLDTIQEICAVSEMEDKAGILLIDDDPWITDLLRTVLESSNREILIAATAKEAEAVLEEKKVSLILLDLILPDTDGRNFLVRLKERPSTANVPVIVLSAKLGAQPKTECFALGADAYYEKPFEVETICAAVSAWLYRTEGNLRESRRDHLTGLPNRAAFREGFASNVSMASRRGEPVSAAILDLDRFKYINDTFGHAAGDEVLRRTGAILIGALRKSDLLARWGGEEFVALFPNTSMEGAGMAVRKALEALSAQKFQASGGRSFHVTFSAGVTEIAANWTVEEAIAEADRFLYLAKAQGRNCVLTSKDTPSHQPRSILLAEADETISAIIKSRLGREGFGIKHVMDGETALQEAATGAYSMCILDAKLAGLDGMQLLTSLRSTQAASNLPILLLTAMGKEKDIARGFQLGADDYLVKPFSPFELVARVRNILRKT
ncbi:MAG: Response regulator receiver protein [Fibrobacteres bacterium]|nr:Response regulator receiver protein [Fibrobacterota bacterium]